jgi:dTDP-4-dehydrorhamnose reductase
VDRAESEPSAAFAVNAAGAENLARACLKIGSRLIHLSTDFVFDGRLGRPYCPRDKPNPLCVYGASKLAGEQAVAKILGDEVVILRTAWVYSRFGRNFVKTMLRLLRDRDEIRIVADQIGSPTWAGTLAEVIWRCIEFREQRGLLHATDAGVASWYDLAIAVQEVSQSAGLLHHQTMIHPIRTEDYPTPAARPSLSALDCSATWRALNLEPRHWRKSLETMLNDAVSEEHA